MVERKKKDLIEAIVFLAADLDCLLVGRATAAVEGTLPTGCVRQQGDEKPSTHPHLDRELFAAGGTLGGFFEMYEVGEVVAIPLDEVMGGRDHAKHEVE